MLDSALSKIKVLILLSLQIKGEREGGRVSQGNTPTLTSLESGIDRPIYDANIEYPSQKSDKLAIMFRCKLRESIQRVVEVHECFNQSFLRVWANFRSGVKLWNYYYGGLCRCYDAYLPLFMWKIIRSTSLSLRYFQCYEKWQRMFSNSPSHKPSQNPSDQASIRPWRVSNDMCLRLKVLLLLIMDNFT